MSKNNGGPAFPTRLANHGFETIEGYEGEEIASGMCSIYPGMTLRDYFATHAPDVPVWFRANRSMDDETYENILFAWRWYYADAMLKSRGE